jgi:hypothetical protein
MATGLTPAPSARSSIDIVSVTPGLIVIGNEAWMIF